MIGVAEVISLFALTLSIYSVWVTNRRIFGLTGRITFIDNYSQKLSGDRGRDVHFTFANTGNQEVIIDKMWLSNGHETIPPKLHSKGLRYESQCVGYGEIVKQAIAIDRNKFSFSQPTNFWFSIISTDETVRWLKFELCPNEQDKLALVFNKDTESYYAPVTIKEYAREPEKSC